MSYKVTKFRSRHGKQPEVRAMTLFTMFAYKMQELIEDGYPKSAALRSSLFISSMKYFADRHIMHTEHTYMMNIINMLTNACQPLLTAYNLIGEHTQIQHILSTSKLCQSAIEMCVFGLSPHV